MAEIPPEYEVSAARYEDLAALPAIEIAAAAAFPAEDLAPELRDEVDPPEFFAAALAERRIWVARIRPTATPVGFAVATLVDGSAHLQEIDVLPAHGRQGLGRALVTAVSRWARAAGHASVTLTTFRHLPWNAPFYAQLGFAELPDREVGPELRARLAEEAAEGLDPEKRIAMRLELATD